MKKPLLLGSDNFETIIKEGCYYIDKTDLINELFENKAHVYLFTRPRRFGKSLNMSMLKHFFSIDSDKSLFNGLKISENKELCEKYQNKYPVISITLKEIQSLSFTISRNLLSTVIGDEASKFKFLLKSKNLDDDDKNRYKQLVELNTNNYGIEAPVYSMSDAMLRNSLKLLSALLYKHYSKKPIILIDEYDVPLNQAFYHGYYDDMVTLIRGVFDNALKSNEYLEFAVLTGCLRISKESIFTGLNNLSVYNVTDNKFSSCFGFTDNEVKELLTYYGAEERYDDAKNWYDGFRIGKNDMFSPWDIVSYAQEAKDDKSAMPKSYWTSTSQNEIIKELLAKADKSVKEDIETLIAGGTISKRIKQDIVYGELYDSIDNIWSVMLSTGYLTAKGTEPTDDNPNSGLFNTILAIPNYEIRLVYIDKIREWFKHGLRKQTESLTALQTAFFSGDAESVEKILNKFLVNTITLRDDMRQKDAKESFYHGILLGLLSSEYVGSCVIKSNLEAGKGYCDIYMVNEDESIGAVVELKVAHNGTMETACNTAIEQIENKNYSEVFDPEITPKVYKYGIGCKKMHCKVKVI